MCDVSRRRLLGFAACALALTGVPAAAECRRGDAIEVFWQGDWYKARALRFRDGRCKVTYDGYESSWDEWVGPQRYRFHVGPGSAVDVYWKGDWYPARVLERRGASYYVTYDGYARSWDEWVGSNRLRPR